MKSLARCVTHMKHEVKNHKSERQSMASQCSSSVSALSNLRRTNQRQRFYFLDGTLAILAALCIAWPQMIAGQNLTGEINGSVRDSTGAAVANATVTVENTDKNLVVRTIHSNEEGDFTIPLLTIGQYSVTVAAPGFRTITENEQVNVGLTVTLSLVLQPGSVSQTVEVTADALTPQLESPSAGTLISGTQTKELSLSSRNFEQLLYIQPGVSGPIPGPLDRGSISHSGAGNFTAFTVGGLGPQFNSFFLDGQDLQRRSAGGNQIAAYPGIDFIQETNSQRSNFGAQYGGSGAAIVSVATKSGASAFHGSAFEFFESQILNANGYFNNLGRLPKPGQRYNDYGYTIGGPIWFPHLEKRNTAKTFFYFGQEYLRSETSTQETLTNMPTALQRQGVFSAPVCVAYNASGACTNSSATITTFDPTASAYLKDIIDKTPLPNNPSDSQGLVTAESGFDDETQTFIRIDHQFSQKLGVFFRFLDDPLHLYAPNGLRQALGVPGVGNSNITDGATLYLGHVIYVLNDKNVLDAGYSYMQNWVTATPVGLLLPANSPDITPVLPYPSTLARIPNLSINGGSYAAIGPYRNTDPVTQLYMNDTVTSGRHTLNVGFNLEYQQAGNNQGTTNAGAFTFSPSALAPGSSETQYDQAFANFLLGSVTNFQQASADLADLPHTNIYEGYAQDDFRVMPRLTLNLGLRYSYFAQPTSGKLSGYPFYSQVNFVPSVFNAGNAPAMTNTGLICTSSPCAGGAIPNPGYNQYNGLIISGKTSPYGQKVTQQPLTAFAPRIGIAYDLSGNGRTAIRGGAGIFFQQISNYQFQVMVNTNPPNVYTVSVNNTFFGAPGTGNTLTSSTPLVIQAAQFNAVNPYVEAWSLDVQHQIGSSLMLDIGYFGNKAFHLPITEDINAPTPGLYATQGIIPGNKVTSGNTQYLNPIRPYRGYGPIDSQLESSFSDYNSLQLSASKHLTNGSILSLNYTYSKALSNANAPQDIYNPAAEYGLTANGRKNIVNANFVYHLPFFADQRGIGGRVLGGWELTGIVSYGSGAGLTAVAANVDPAGEGLLAGGSSENGTARPDQVANPNSNAPHTRVAWFNTAAFAQVPSGQFRPGTARIGSIVAPGYGNWDLSLFKNVRVRENLAFQLRAESFNAFNHVNFSTVSTTLGQTNFGQVTGTGSPRVMQLGAKLTF
jgi:hypothetical protein